MCLQDLVVDSDNVQITDPGDQAEDATGGQEIPTVLVESSPTLITDSGASAGQDLEGTEDHQDVIIEEGSGHGSGSGASRDSNNVSTYQQATALLTHTQDDDLQFAAELVSAYPAPNFHAESSGAVVRNMDDQFVTAFALILYFLIASTTLICYVAVATALLECLV